MSLPEGVTLAHPTDLYIGGRWVAPAAGGRIEVVSPDTEQVSAVVAAATEPDMDAAVAAARPLPRPNWLPIRPPMMAPRTAPPPLLCWRISTWSISRTVPQVWQ